MAQDRGAAAWADEGEAKQKVTGPKVYFSPHPPNINTTIYHKRR